MIKLLHLLIQNFVPQPLLNDKMSLQYRKCKFLLWSCLVIILNGLIFLPFYFLFFEFNSLFQAVTISYISVLLIPLYIRRGGQLETAGTMILLNTFVVLFTSLLHGSPYPNPNLAWYSLLPIAAAFLVSANAAWWAALACIISNYALYILGTEGIPAPMVETQSYPVEFNLIRYSMIYLSSALIAKIFVHSWEDMYAQRTLLLEDKDQLNQKLLEARDEALKENKIRALFTASVGHEIKNPLNGILGLIDMLSKTDLNTKQKQYVDIMIKTGANLVNIIKDLLDLTRIEEGKLQIEDIPFSLSQVVHNVEDLYRSQCEAKNLKLSVDIAENLPNNALGDPTRLNQIFINLMDNAIKFTREGEIKFSVSQRTQSDRNILIEVKVEDTGIGIKPEQLATLFTPFTQGEVGITKQFGGSGLGLAIVKELVELMQGIIKVESTPGVGSLFTLHIPLRKAPGYQS